MCVASGFHSMRRSDDDDLTIYEYSYSLAFKLPNEVPRLLPQSYGLKKPVCVLLLEKWNNKLRMETMKFVGRWSGQLHGSTV